jgi:hypothetical protein
MLFIKLIFFLTTGSKKNMKTFLKTMIAVVAGLGVYNWWSNRSSK